MAAPTPSPCAERERLTRELREAIHGVAAVSGPQSREAFVPFNIAGSETDTQAAERRRSAATAALMRHIEEHGCKL